MFLQPARGPRQKCPHMGRKPEPTQLPAQERFMMLSDKRPAHGAVQPPSNLPSYFRFCSP